MSWMKKKEKWLVIPCIVCIVVLIFFLFYTATNTSNYFEIFNYQFYVLKDSNSTSKYSSNKIGKNIPGSTKAFMKQVNYSSTTTRLQTSTMNPTLGNLSHCLCPIFMNGFGNQMFQFASNFGIAMYKGMRIIVSKHSEVNLVFKLHDIDIWDNINICNKFTVRREKQACAYEPNLINFPNSNNSRIFPCLQSWKYFYDSRIELKKQFTFRDRIRQEAENNINQIIKRLDIRSARNITLVGVHIRRGDMVNHGLGFNVATSQYLTKAMHYFNSKYQNVKFIISSLDVPWTKANIPNNTNIIYTSYPKREIVVATLALCNHTITTVGSFGWWIGWLTGGEVTYFKWPAKEGSFLRTQYSKDYSDFFYPGWIGM
ncbi:galactoside alpha-(1,2)-fucosyltransferase 1-like [Mytilus trossulus]|uniref:galactoside alpha-(1,2)-fucosyltransferase 1-like n=1 Tax=Mytilus trossulus TaxID=6551 RepID=UPI003006C997